MTEPTALTQAERRSLVEAIHDTPTGLVLAVAGGGNAVITDLLDVAGASRTVLEIRVPYAERALRELLAGSETSPHGGSSVGVVSEATARAMAEACLGRAGALADPDQPVIGVACTAALASDRPKRGDHRAHLAVARAGEPGVVEAQLVSLHKDRLDRADEDRIVADAVLAAIARGCGIEGGAG